MSRQRLDSGIDRRGVNKFSVFGLIHGGFVTLFQPLGARSGGSPY
jgi:hypothetical protein